MSKANDATDWLTEGIDQISNAVNVLNVIYIPAHGPDQKPVKQVMVKSARDLEQVPGTTTVERSHVSMVTASKEYKGWRFTAVIGNAEALEAGLLPEQVA